jgi:hypothetical protein
MCDETPLRCAGPRPSEATGQRTFGRSLKMLHNNHIQTNLKQGHPAARDSVPGPADMEIPSMTMGAQFWLQGRRTVTHEG